MCTAVSFTTKDHYFGRTLDHTCSYNEEIVVAPRKFPFDFRHSGTISSHYAIIGMAHVADGYPLLYDAVNEKGLAMAGLNFVGYARYGKPAPGMDNIAQFELLPWILSRCEDVAEARTLIERLNIVDTPFSQSLPTAELHWMIADRTGAIVVEATADGLHVHDAQLGVMTNNPGFEWHMQNMSRYMHLTPCAPENMFGDTPLQLYTNGLGAVGLPGDMSSPSRFVRAAFMRRNSVCDDSESASVSQFFHIMSTVEQPRGCCITPDGRYMTTIYTSCCNTDRGIYYYKTYDGHVINGIDMNKEYLDTDELITFALANEIIRTIN